MKPLTKRQAQILELIRDQINSTGMPPTRAELARTLGFKSANAAEEHLKALAKKGAIEILPGTSRGIKLVDNPTANDDTIPLVGRVAAGEPILAQEHVECDYKIDPTMFHPEAHFLLRVTGMSMKDIGILDGDLLAVHKTQDVKNGQVVVARIEDEVTVKRYEREGSAKDVLLHPENADFETIVVDLQYESFDIEGVAVGIIRNTSWM
ncbi:transcriptional repressor LexA [Motilimonas pumila]|uniref:LexA repressor n=1 Tax=Motilimonas pumila TaxID=2303987 RepID=A0A418YHB1_9GAMM|nr:transcriptional repressor LexA [Motilimonas pumila]RJG49443.1 repressor LexA [Motilimonas pumila]